MYKNFWRLIRTWITHNHKAYYTFVLMSALGLYNFWYFVIIEMRYKKINHHRSLAWALQNEREYQANKPAEDDDDDEEEEEE